MNTDQTPSPDVSAVRSHVLEFPELTPWPEAVDGRALLDELTALFRRFVVLPPSAAEALALWTLHTHAFQLRDVSSYLGLESPEKRCGKTTLLGVLSELVARPVVAANISSPAFFRLIEEVRPTLLIDEADTFLRGNDELRGILNSGYSRKTAYVVRVVHHGPAPAVREGASMTAPELAASTSLVRFSCWCPKAMAAIGRLPDTLADRCIVIRMQRKTAREECQRLRHLQAEGLRRRCVRFVQDHAAQIASAEPALPPALHDRAADIWEPLFALADLAGGDWPQLARQAAVTITGCQDNNPIGSLLLDIFVLFSELKTERLFSRQIVEHLNTLSGRAWIEMNKGKEITELWLAQKLRPYGIRPKTIWIGDDSAKGYRQSDLLDISRRYVTRSDLEALTTPDRDEEPAAEGTDPEPEDGSEDARSA
jgi:hypothetical protein